MEIPKIVPGESFCRRFQCTAGSCLFTCCQQWIISVDQDTERRWRKIPVSRLPGMEEPDSRLDRNLAAGASGSGSRTETAETKIRSADPGSHGRKQSLAEAGICTDRGSGIRKIRLNRDGCCPFLTGKSLCGVQVAMEDQNDIPQTCRVFPRIQKEYPDRTEYSLSACCPEVIRMALEMPEGFPDLLREFCDPDVSDFLYQVRRQVLCILADESIPLRSAVLAAAYVLLDIRDRIEEDRRKNGGKRNISSPEAGWFQKYEAPDFRDSLLSAVSKAAPDEGASFRENLELFLDLTENYHRAGMYSADLGPARDAAGKLCGENGRSGRDPGAETTMFSLTDAADPDDRPLRALILLECVSQLVTESSGFRNLILTYEWIVLELSLARTMRYLCSPPGGHTGSPESELRLLTEASRIMGFPESDIFAYMESAFDEPVWSWGYYDLVMG